MSETQKPSTTIGLGLVHRDFDHFASALHEKMHVFWFVQKSTLQVQNLAFLRAT